MPVVEVDPQAVKYWKNGEYLSGDPYYSQRKGDIYKLLEGLETLPLAEHIPTKAVAFICGLSAIGGYRFAWVEHRPSKTMSEKAAILSEKQAEIAEQLGMVQPEIHPLKTVTLQIQHQQNPYYFLVSGLGDFRIDGKMKKAMEPAVQRILEAEGKVMTGRTRINPLEEFPPDIHLGLRPGIVSPFADLTRFGEDQRLSGLLYYRGSGVGGYVAVAVSETTTLIVDHSIFPSALNQWQGFYLNIPFRAIGGEENL